jgi:hypothetical protein
MTTFTTTITNMFTLPQVDGKTDVVVNVRFNITGVDGQYTANTEGSQICTLTSGQEFTPYNELTQNQVIGWLDPQMVTNFQECVQGLINIQITPPVSPAKTALPWSA